MTRINSQKNKTSKARSGGKKKSRRPGCLLILVVLYLIILAEGLRARYDWNVYTEHWQSKGEIFDLQKLIPAKLPSADNFAEHPIISELFNSNVTPPLKKLSLAEIPHLQQAIRFAQQPFAARDRRSALGSARYSLIDYIAAPHTIPNEHQAAEFILEQLKPLHLLFDQLEQASKRPLAKFPLQYDNFLTVEYDHIESLQEAVMTLTLKSRAQLTIGNSHAATLDLLESLRLAELIGCEPTLMSHLVQQSFCKSALSVIHFGLKNKLFEPDDLISIQAELETQKLEKRLLLAIRTERALTLSFIDACEQGRLPALDHTKSSAKLNRMFRLYGFLQISKPFIYRNKLNYAKFIQEHGLKSKDKINLNKINFGTVRNIKTDLQELEDNSYFPFNLYSIFIRMPLYPYQDIVETSLETATRIDLARIAIALELHRLEHGTYPKTLAPLTPNYLKSVPLDLISGKPFIYHTKADGTPIIYSVGINQIDEGGLLKKDRKLGDWVWQYTLPDEFNSIEWRE